MKVLLRFADSNKELELQVFSKEKQRDILRKKVLESLVIDEKIYVVKSIQGDTVADTRTIVLDALKDPDIVVTDNDRIIQKQFDAGDRVKVFIASGPEDAKYCNKIGTVIEENIPDIPIERRHRRGFRFYTIVKVKLDEGQIIEVIDTILQRILEKA